MALDALKQTANKAIAGATAAAATGVGTAFLVVPDGVTMPWYGYVTVAVVNAAIGFGVVYLAPRNTTKY